LSYYKSRYFAGLRRMLVTLSDAENPGFLVYTLCELRL